MTLKEKIDLIFDKGTEETVQKASWLISITIIIMDWERAEGSPFYRPLDFYKPNLKRTQIKNNALSFREIFSCHS